MQAVINCRAGGSCNGGSLSGPYAFAQSHGIPEMGCQVYTASNPAKQSCSAIQRCMNCKWGQNYTQQCWSISTYTSWYTSQYGRIVGPDQMKAEIYNRGPISCGIDVTNKFENYTGGIYSEKKLLIQINHAISVNGWGVDPKTNEEYWIVRNSWGTHFGLNGYFKIKMHNDNLGIDSHECWWGVPSATKSSEEFTQVDA